MNRVAKFEKVSEKQYIADYLNIFKGGNENFIKENIYSKIVLPARSTSGSAGYDFVSPIGFTLKPGETIKIPSGIRCKMNNDYVLSSSIVVLTTFLSSITLTGWIFLLRSFGLI